MTIALPEETTDSGPEELYPQQSTAQPPRPPAGGAEQTGPGPSQGAAAQGRQTPDSKPATGPSSQFTSQGGLPTIWATPYRVKSWRSAWALGLARIEPSLLKKVVFRWHYN